jgi:hypothetical protein
MLMRFCQKLPILLELSITINKNKIGGIGKNSLFTNNQICFNIESVQGNKQKNLLEEFTK